MQPEQQQRIMGYFIEEAKDHLNTIEQGLLNLQNTLEDPEMINEMFRAAHSVKGGAAMLGLNSIQHVGHRLEDYFKILKDSPVKVDQKLETLFLQVFDALQELLGQLQGPFGLTDESANVTVSGVEPTFQELEQHLGVLTGVAATLQPIPEMREPIAASDEDTAQSDSELLIVFKNEIPIRLRDMLQLFKQTEDRASRQQLQEVCQDLIRLGEQFNLSNWCSLIEAARRAIAHSQNPYRTLAPLVIKDIKRAQDAVLAGQVSEISPCPQLQELLPVSLEEVEVIVDENNDVSLQLTYIQDAQLLVEQSASESVAIDSFLPSTEASISFGSALDQAFEDVPPEEEHHGPEVGIAELNSLADLFEGEVPDLASTWQEEEILGDATEVFMQVSEPVSDDTNDFSDLLFDSTPVSEPVAAQENDLNALFGDEISEESFDSSATESPVPSANLLNEMGDDLTELFTLSDSTHPATSGTSSASINNFEEINWAVDQSDDKMSNLHQIADNSSTLLEGSEFELEPVIVSEEASLENLGELFAGMDEKDLEFADAQGPLPTSDVSQEQAEEQPQLAADTSVQEIVADPWDSGDSLDQSAPITTLNDFQLDDLSLENVTNESAESVSVDDTDLNDLFGLEMSTEPIEELSEQDEPDFSSLFEASATQTDQAALEDLTFEDLPLEERAIEDNSDQAIEALLSNSDLEAADTQAPIDLGELDLSIPATSNNDDSVVTAVSESDPQEALLGAVTDPWETSEQSLADFLALDTSNDQVYEDLDLTNVDLSEFPASQMPSSVATESSEPIALGEETDEFTDLLTFSAEPTSPPDESDDPLGDLFGSATDATTEALLEFSNDEDESDESSDSLTDLFTSTEGTAEALLELGIIEETNFTLNTLTSDQAEAVDLSLEDLDDLNFDSKPGLGEEENSNLESLGDLNLDLEAALLGSEQNSDLNVEGLGDLNLELELESSDINLDLGLNTADASNSRLEDFLGEIASESTNEAAPLQELSDELLNFDNADEVLEVSELSINALTELEAPQSLSEEVFDLESFSLETSDGSEDLFEIEPSNATLDFSENLENLFDDADQNLNSDLQLNLETASLETGWFAGTSDFALEGLGLTDPERTLDEELLSFDESLLDLNSTDLNFSAAEDSSLAEIPELILGEASLSIGEDSLELNATSLDLSASEESLNFDENLLELDELTDPNLGEATSLDSDDLNPQTDSDLSELSLDFTNFNSSGDLAHLSESLQITDDSEADNFDDLLGSSLEIPDELSELGTFSATDTIAESENGNSEFDQLLEETSDSTGGLLNFNENSFSQTSSMGADFDELDSLLDEATDLHQADPTAINDFALSEPDEFANLESLIDEETGTDDFSELEGLLDSDLASSADAALTDFASISTDDFADLDALLEDSASQSAAFPFQSSTTTPIKDSEFDELDELLKEAEEKMGGSPTVKASRGLAPQNRRPARQGRVFTEQTMRVSVKHLDNLSNLVGELVVNRNSLEQDQERLRQSLDNLLYQVQQLSDVGQRMQDLYERSLLESSLLASRHGHRHPVISSSRGDGSTQTTHSMEVEYDPLEMDRFTGFHSLSQEMIELIVRVRESASDIEFVVDETEQVTRMFRQVTTQLQEGLTRSRMVPFAQTADRLPRAVRDISIKVGKQAELQIEGRETLIDKMILEQLYDPMTHLVNNAITHGIESPEVRQAAGKSPAGKIMIRAFHQGNQTIISVSDDGAGIDVERVRTKAIEKGLITPAEARSLSRLDIYDILFHPGFSTKDQADDFAGRGVGMDVVRTSLSDIRGTITTDSTQGKGTTFTIRLPLTLSISKALCCISDRARIAFPMDGVEDMLDVPKDRIQLNEEGQPSISWRDSILPLHPLTELLAYNRHLSRGSVYGGSQEDDIVSIVVLRSAGNFLALQVDQVLGEQEIVIKQLEGPVPKPVGIAGATVLGDGRIMPIADVLELIDLSMGRIRKDVGGSLWEQGATPTIPETATKTDPMVLIVDDSITVRELLSMTFNKVGYRVEQARDGQEAWEKLRSGLPCDIVFCDIEMPRMDGLELLSRIQKDANLNQLPIAMLTSRGADRHRQMAASLGASGYFTKPYLEEALLDAAQRMLKGEKLISNS